jgi:hypothetical protein
MHSLYNVYCLVMEESTDPIMLPITSSKLMQKFFSFSFQILVEKRATTSSFIFYNLRVGDHTSNFYTTEQCKMFSKYILCVYTAP